MHCAWRDVVDGTHLSNLAAYLNMLHAKIMSSNDWKQVHFIKPSVQSDDSRTSGLYSNAKV